MGYLQLDTPAEYARLSAEATQIFLEREDDDPALARAWALRHVVENCPITIEPDAFLLGGENPFFFNLLLDALSHDRYAREHQWQAPEAGGKLRQAGVLLGPCFEGHITPGLEFILGQGVEGLRWRVEEQLRNLRHSGVWEDFTGWKHRATNWYEALLLCCDSLLIYARRYGAEARRLADVAGNEEYSAEWRQAAEVLDCVPEHPSRTFHQALQSFWLVYTLVTLEMGGCCPGGGLGLGRLDQFLYPYYAADIARGTITRAQALELLEIFLLGFRHVDYYTWHQVYTPGSQSSLGGVTPTGLDASNELTELLMEASLRIAMPAPYLSIRLHKDAPERYWQAAANYVVGGLGFPIVNDEALIPAFLRHGRALGDARDYICSCCYENTIPGREAFHPSGTFLNLLAVLEFALHDGHSLLSGETTGCNTGDSKTVEKWGQAREVVAESDTERAGERKTGTGSGVPRVAEMWTSVPVPAFRGDGFTMLLVAFRTQLHFVCDSLVDLVNTADAALMRHRRYPLMSLFIEDCLARGLDVCAGGARYNLTGCIVAGLPNVVNSLAAIKYCVFERQTVTMSELLTALRADFHGYDEVRSKLLDAPKWGNGDELVDEIATIVTEMLYEEIAPRVNARGGRWQLALYSFVANHQLGNAVGASPDGRKARESLTRNLNPAWGTDRNGPTAVLSSLSHIDAGKFPNGCSLDLRFDPAPFQSATGREKFADFLKGFVELKVMQMQISMVDTNTLLHARKHPEQHPDLMVKVAGYSARFVDLNEQEQYEIIGRTAQIAG